MKLSENAKKVLRERYLRKDDHGEVIETPEEMFQRVAHHVASADRLYDENADVEKTAEEFYEIMSSLDFLPNSPTLMNAGKELGQLSACFVLPIEDDLGSIYETLKNAALIHQSGGGTGFSFSRLRPKGDVVRSTMGVASGPVSFMKVYDASTEEVKQGGCLVPETLVLTEKGLLQLGEIVGENVPGWYAHTLLVYTDEGWRVSKEKYNNGESSLYRLSLECGVEITGTPQHKVKVWNPETGREEWKKFEDLSGNELVKISLGGYRGCDPSLKLPSYKRHGKQKSVKLPAVLSPELGWLLGYIYGNGFVAKDGSYRIGATIPDSKPYIKQRFKEVVDDLFGLSCTICRKEEEAAETLVINNKEVWHFFMCNGFDKERSFCITVPYCIRTASSETISAFIRGFFDAEGSISEGYPCVSSTSKVFLSTLQVMLFALGIPSSLTRCNTRTNSYGKRPVYDLTIRPSEALRRFVKIIGWRSSTFIGRQNGDPQNERYWLVPEVEGMLEGILEGIGSTYGYGVYRAVYRAVQHYLPNIGHKKNVTYGALRRIVKHFGKILPEEFLAVVERASWTFWDRIKDVSPLPDKRTTLDLSVDGNSTYIANGIVTHNTRRGANMGILRVDHPDILEFIACKDKEGKIKNFNISVALTEKFMKAVEADEEYELVNPRTGKVVKRLKARDVFDSIVEHAWRNGEPGIVFIDRINEGNPTPHAGEIEATNPCGEMPLLPYEACVLGSINLSNMCIESDGRYEVDWQKLERTVNTAVHFLDNVIDVNRYPLPQIEEMTRANRKIGLGVMGFADMLFKLRMPYDSERALELAGDLMRFIQKKARETSIGLAEKRGPFPNFKGSIYETVVPRGIRNATVTTIAPTGSISIIAGCSSGIEPVFALAFTRNVLDGAKLVEVNPVFEETAKEEGFYSLDLMKRIAETGRLDGIDVSESVKRVFVTSHDVSPEWHIRMQAAFQRNTDNAVSKTINFPNGATREDVKEAYLLAYELGCKGLTVYRDGSRKVQVLTAGKNDKDGGKLPDVVDEKRVKIKTKEGNYYIHLGYTNSTPKEVFVTVPPLAESRAWIDCVARLISHALRYGVPIEEILDQLDKSYLQYGDITSPLKALKDGLIKGLESMGKKVALPEKPCPKCGGTLVYQEGCVKCISCDYSKC